MEKKTDKSPVEQMKEFLQMETKHWVNEQEPMGIGRWRGAFNALSRFNELFPEVQQVPIQDIDALADAHVATKFSLKMPSDKLEDSRKVESTVAECKMFCKNDYKAGYKQCLEDSKNKQHH